MKINDIPSRVLARFRQGVAIPAHPLALTAERQFDETYQRALTRYYVDAGAGGVAVGVHSTQFEIRQPEYGLFEPVLQLASETADDWCGRAKKGPMVKIAGVCGQTEQAVKEAAFAESAGYHAVLLSLAALKNESVPAMLEHCRRVAEVMPVVGFYLQPAVGGRVLPYEFWREFAEIDNILGIKMAPFNRYQTLDVIRGVCQAGRENDITLYTGNDDNIIIDLLAEYRIHTADGFHSARIKGGLLGHWAAWTHKAVEQLEQIHALLASNSAVSHDWLRLANEVTDANAAFFDAANGFKGCIAGIHEVLRRQGLMKGIWCLNPDEGLSPGQQEAIDRVYQAYPHLNDNAFVAEHLSEWLAD